MAKKDLQKNLEKMESSGYFSEDVKIDKESLSFSLDALKEDEKEDEKENSKK